jgi:hypothetical protein
MTSHQTRATSSTAARATPRRLARICTAATPRPPQPPAPRTSTPPAPRRRRPPRQPSARRRCRRARPATPAGEGGGAEGPAAGWGRLGGSCWRRCCSGAVPHALPHDARPPCPTSQTSQPQSAHCGLGCATHTTTQPVKPDPNPGTALGPQVPLDLQHFQQCCHAVRHHRRHPEPGGRRAHMRRHRLRLPMWHGACVPHS